MSTVVLDAYSKAYPLITNRIRASVFLETDPAALIATIIDSTSGHPARIWHFPGLPRSNYGFSLDEINGSDIVVNNLALFSVTPASIDGMLVRADEQIKVGVTTGFNEGLQTVVFDGTSGKPNYIGWSIVPSELTGRGILVKGLDYSWDSSTGTMVWLQTGDILATGTVYNIHFDPIVNPAGSSIPTVSDFSSRIVTTTGNILVGDFGNSLIVEPDGNYIELTLPDITTVPQGRAISVETIKLRGTAVQCVAILPFGADSINFLRGNLFMMNNESLQIYRLKRPDNSNEWRVRLADGNFKRVGESVPDDAISSGVYCKKLLDGGVVDKFQYARIYNEVILTLPSTQLVDFDSWNTGNNKYFFSRANSSDPDNLNKFHFPDRRGLFERNNNAGKAGDFTADTVGPHSHTVNPPGANSQAGSGKTTTGGDPLGADLPITQYNTGTHNAGGETAPKHHLINKYILI